MIRYQASKSFAEIMRANIAFERPFKMLFYDVIFLLLRWITAMAPAKRLEGQGA